MRDAQRATAQRLSDRWGRRFPEVPEIGAGLIARYGEPARVYHDVRHLDDVLTRLDELASPQDLEVVVELAAWFHDAVYDVRRSDNEAASADLARSMLTSWLGRGIVDEVARLVIVTADHAVATDDERAAALCDADLAVLAGQPASYAEYSARVRAEFAHVSDEDFRLGRSAVLRQLLGLQRLFHTPYGADRWERAARSNLTHELSSLTER